MIRYVSPQYADQRVVDLYHMTAALAHWKISQSLWVRVCVRVCTHTRVHCRTTGATGEAQSHKGTQGKALSNLTSVVGRSSREEGAFERSLDSFQQNQIARLNSGRYFFSAHLVSVLEPGPEDIKTKETNSSSMSNNHNHRNRNSNTGKQFGIMVVSAAFENRFPVYESQLFCF